MSSSLTAEVVRAVTAALERRRAFLDAEPGLRTITLEVQIHRETRGVRDVIFRPESAGGMSGSTGSMAWDSGGPVSRLR